MNVQNASEAIDLDCFPLLFSLLFLRLQNYPAVIFCIFSPFFFDFGRNTDRPVFVSCIPFSQTATARKNKRNISYSIRFLFPISSLRAFSIWELDNEMNYLANIQKFSPISCLTNRRRLACNVIMRWLCDRITGIRHFFFFRAAIPFTHPMSNSFCLLLLLFLFSFLFTFYVFLILQFSWSVMLHEWKLRT